MGPLPPFRGGIAQHTAALHGALAERHQVQVHPFARLYPRLLFPGTAQTAPGDLVEVPADAALDPYRPASWRRVAERIAAFGPDLVLVQWWHPWFAVPTAALLQAAAARLCGRGRLALVCHNVLPHRRVPLQVALARHALARCGRAIVHAGAEAQRLLALRPALPVHTMALPVILPPPAAPIDRDAARARLGLGSAPDGRSGGRSGGRTGGGPWLLFFGLVREYKGLEDLLVAMAQPCCREVNLLVLGEFYAPIARYRRLVARLGLRERVHLRNRYVPSAEVPAAFAAADAVVLPYRRATQSAVVPLAARARRPVVVTDTGGLAEAAAGIGKVVPPRDPAALAQAVAEVLRGPAVPEGAFRAAEERFGLPAARAALEAIAAAAGPLPVRAGAHAG